MASYSAPVTQLSEGWEQENCTHPTGREDMHIRDEFRAGLHLDVGKGDYGSEIPTATSRYVDARWLAGKPKDACFSWNSSPETYQAEDFARSGSPLEER